MIDAIAGERHFADHLSPVWQELPVSVRGTFYAEAGLIDHVRARGIDAVALDAMAIRRLPQVGPRPNGDRPALVASIGDTKIGRRLGYGPFIRLEHGAGQAYLHDRTGSYAGGPGNEDAALVLCPNDYSADHWRRAYPQARVAVVGCPKLDTLPQKETHATSGSSTRERAARGDGRDDGAGSRRDLRDDPERPAELLTPTVAVSWHWPGPGYAGTAWGEFRKALPELAARYTVIGHEHPNWSQRRLPGAPSKTYAQLGIPFVPDFEDVCRQADVYVADNTSTLWEFASTGRPVVVVNSRAWSRKVEMGLRFWDASHVGVNVDRPDMLVAAVMAALSDDIEAQQNREHALALVYQPRTNATAYAVTAILDWLASRQAVAA